MALTSNNRKDFSNAPAAAVPRSLRRTGPYALRPTSSSQTPSPIRRPSNLMVKRVDDDDGGDGNIEQENENDRDGTSALHGHMESLHVDDVQRIDHGDNDNDRRASFGEGTIPTDNRRNNNKIHALRRLWSGPLFGRLSRAGRKYLIQNHGFVEEEVTMYHPQPTSFDGEDPREGEEPAEEAASVVDGHNTRLAFVWPTKSGPQFDVDDVRAAHVRPYPKRITDLFDDKIVLARILAKHHHHHHPSIFIAPRHIESPSEALSNKLYFAKHRHGAQGKGVHVFDKEELVRWWDRNRRVRDDYLIQEEIIPCLDGTGKKFVIRCHVLLMQKTREPDITTKRSSASSCLSSSPSSSSRFSSSSCPLYSVPIAFLHKTSIVCQPHARPYEPNSRDRIVQVSQGSGFGKRKTKNKKEAPPSPSLLHELILSSSSSSSSHPASTAYPSIKSSTKELMKAVLPYLPSSSCSGQSHTSVLSSSASYDVTTRKTSSTTAAVPSNALSLLFALLGVDIVLDDRGRAQICEVNSHPALGWGTMSNVRASAFDGLIRDTLSLLLSYMEKDDDSGFDDAGGVDQGCENDPGDHCAAVPNYERLI